MNLIFATTAVETIPLPYAGVWFAPTNPPFAQLSRGTQRYGSLVGSVTSMFGTTNVSEIGQATDGGFAITS